MVTMLVVILVMVAVMIISCVLLSSATGDREEHLANWLGTHRPGNGKLSYHPYGCGFRVWGRFIAALSVCPIFPFLYRSCS